MSESNPFFDGFSNTEDNEPVVNETVVSEPQIVTSISTTPTPETNFMTDMNPFDSNSFTSNSITPSSNNNSNKKYYIRDNYWFINMKLYRKEKLEDNEAPYVTVSFNSQYDNLRIVFLSPGPDAFTSNAIIRSKCKVITTVNIFAETCEALLYYYDKSESKVVPWHSLERLIQANTEWKPNNTKFELDKKNNRITLYTSPVFNNNSKAQVYKFTFDDYQTEGFLNVCKFMRKEAWLISNIGQFLINN